LALTIFIRASSRFIGSSGLTQIILPTEVAKNKIVVMSVD